MVGAGSKRIAVECRGMDLRGRQGGAYHGRMGVGPDWLGVDRTNKAGEASGDDRRRGTATREMERDDTAQFGWRGWAWR